MEIEFIQLIASVLIKQNTLASSRPYVVCLNMKPNEYNCLPIQVRGVMTQVKQLIDQDSIQQNDLLLTTDDV